MTVLQARGLGKRYRRLWALSDCTLSVPAGHVVGLVGPNGAGKTTLLSLVFAVLLAVTGPHLASLYAASGIGGCHDGGCGRLASSFVGQLQANGPYPALYVVSIAVIILTPALIGVFWGAPLIARELETGTFRLAWTQSVSRARWLAVKLGLAGLAAMAVTEILSLMQA